MFSRKTEHASERGIEHRRYGDKAFLAGNQADQEAASEHASSAFDRRKEQIGDLRGRFRAGRPANSLPEYSMRRYSPSGHDHSIYIERLLIAAALLMLLLLAWQAIDLLLLVFGAVVFAVLLRAVADPIEHRTPLGTGGSAGVAILLLVSLVGLVAWFLGRQIGGEFGDLARTIPAAWRGLQAQVSELPWGEQAVSSLGGALPSETSVVSRLGNLLMTLGSGLADLLLVLVGGMFFAIRPGLYRRGLLKLVPSRARPSAGDALSDSGRALKLWLLGQLVSMAAIGLLTGLGLWLIGLPSALALGVIAGLFEFIPYAGPFLAAIPGVLIALLIGPEMALYTLAVYVGIQQIESYLILPVVQRKAVELPPALTLFAVVAAALLFGTLGLMLAAPLTVVAFVLVKRLYVREALDTWTSIPGEKKGGG